MTALLVVVVPVSSGHQPQPKPQMVEPRMVKVYESHSSPIQVSHQALRLTIAG